MTRSDETPADRLDEVDESSDESFPASDPPGWTTLTGAHVRASPAPDEHDEIVIEHDREKQRFVAKASRGMGILAYERRDDGAIVLLHTRVPKGLEGHGIAGRLAKTALEYARQKGLKVVPQCEFVAAYIERHPDFKDLVTD